jgi:hypothetical protein
LLIYRYFERVFILVTLLNNFQLRNLPPTQKLK